jgi:UDP-GlcNAc:undecaprenyl-phosphate GlcNAc-1-phosphate transferase
MISTLLQPLTQAPASVPPEIAARISSLGDRLESLTTEFASLLQASGVTKGGPTRLELFHGYMAVFVVAFVTTLLVTPLMRRVAIAYGVIDRPTVARKIHKAPTPYLGGVAVYLGILFAAIFSYTTPLHGLVEFHTTGHVAKGLQLPGGLSIWILVGMTVIMACGLLDDVKGIHPRAKIAGMLFAAAALATMDIGVRVAAGVIVPAAKALGFGTSMVGGLETVLFTIPLPMGGGSLSFDIVYWVGTAIIAIFVLGACNASNLIDGLDGLCSGVTIIANAGLLVIALGMAQTDDGVLDGARIVLCLGVLGACLGFLPYNFNPANIFLGDAGSLLLGFCTIVIVLTLGDTGRTDLVLAGLIIYLIPIIDTSLAIVRRKLAGKSISDADDQHLHHMLKRALGVKGAVFAIYGIASSFAVLGIALSEGRARVTYALTLVFVAFIGVTAFKIARRNQEQQVADAAAARSTEAASLPKPAQSPGPAVAAGGTEKASGPRAA